MAPEPSNPRSCVLVQVRLNEQICLEIQPKDAAAMFLIRNSAGLSIVNSSVSL